MKRLCAVCGKVGKEALTPQKRPLEWLSQNGFALREAGSHAHISCIFAARRELRAQGGAVK